MTQIGSLMTRHPLVVQTTTSLVECAEIVVQFGVRHLPVVEADRSLTGLLTDFLLFQHGRFNGPNKDKWIYYDTSGRNRTAGDIASPALTVGEDQALSEALTRLGGSRTDSVVVTDDEGHPAGILTEHDLVRYAGRVLPEGSPVHEIASHPILTIERFEQAHRALELMLSNHVRHLVVISEGMLYGVLSLRDVVRATSPSGSTLRCDQVISSPVVHKATEQTSTRAAARRMAEWKIGCLPVVDEQDRPMAIVTRRDIMGSLMDHVHE